MGDGEQTGMGKLRMDIRRKHEWGYKYTNQRGNTEDAYIVIIDK